MQLQRAVEPARVNASTKVFAIAVLFATLAGAATIAMIQARLPKRVVTAVPPPDWSWVSQDRLTRVELPPAFTLSTHLRVTDADPSYDPILSNGQVMLGKRGANFEVVVLERDGETTRFENSTPAAPGSLVHVAITRSGPRLSLWVDGNETRIDHFAPLLDGERLAIDNKWRALIANVTVWNRVLDARQLAAIQ